MDVFDSNGVGRITGEQLSLQRLSVVEWELPAGEEEVEAGGIVVSSPETLSGFLGHPVNGEVGTWLAPSGSQIRSPFACPYSRLQ